MRSIFVIVAEVFIQQVFQMPFIHHDHVVKEIPAAVANPTLGDTIGLGRQLQRTATLPIPTSR
jgi:hypothetical protein